MQRVAVISPEWFIPFPGIAADHHSSGNFASPEPQRIFSTLIEIPSRILPHLVIPHVAFGEGPAGGCLHGGPGVRRKQQQQQQHQHVLRCFFLLVLVVLGRTGSFFVFVYFTSTDASTSTACKPRRFNHLRLFGFHLLLFVVRIE